ncbi:uncharacterized protein LOC128735478 [Sabethes cyaneus]|uniref:uncharacterized protein LOC128735478 n=1 Tax=Sabethes cyaneus TaxID=53552 RepID=UPI00237EB380|nr:uncharacterized protein LOC128735478 [Sabethes cyaneus]
MPPFRFTMDEKNSINDVIINFVREHPILYDKSLRSYKNNNARNKLWQTLAGDLKMEVKAITTRWRSLRDKFNKETKPEKSGSDAPDIPRWEYFDSMSFLKDHLMHRKTISNYNIEEHPEEFLELNNNIDENVEEVLDNFPISAKKRKMSEVDQKMNSILDNYLSKPKLRHDEFCHLLNVKLSSLPFEAANKLEASVLELVYNTVNECNNE